MPTLKTGFGALENQSWNHAALEWHQHTAKNMDDEISMSLMRRLFHLSILPQYVAWDMFTWLHSHNMLLTKLPIIRPPLSN